MGSVWGDYGPWADAFTSTYANSEYINTLEKYINTPCSAPPPSPPSAFKSPGFLAGARPQDAHWPYRPPNQADRRDPAAYDRRGGGGFLAEIPSLEKIPPNAQGPVLLNAPSTGVDGLPGVAQRLDGLGGSSAAAVGALDWRGSQRGTLTRPAMAAFSRASLASCASKNWTRRHDATPHGLKYIANAALW